MAELSVLGQAGDTKLIWDQRKSAEVQNARKTFDRLVDKGYLAYHVDAEGEKTKRMYEFDEDAEKMILVPPMVGG